MSKQKTWDVATAKQHYCVNNWGAGHFDINSNGNVVVKIQDSELDLHALSNTLRNQGITLPTLVRFPQILQQSLKDLCSAFGHAIQTYNYRGKFVAAYPIKVNQQATVIQHFQQQTEWPIAFEVGSKAELMACYGTTHQPLSIICNGYKDESYIRLALLGNLLGHQVTIVLESLTEYKYVLKQCTQLKVQAHLGMRIRLSSIANGNWQNTGGEYSKFGLRSNEVLSLVNELKENNAMDSMKMLHFHMGSQIPCLKDIQSGITEAMHYFTELAKLGVKFEKLNIGGGLAVDYEGSSSNRYFSMDYSLEDYVDTIINTVKKSCDKHSFRAPDIFSENGRAMTAYHAVLLTNVIDAEYQYIVSDDENEEILDLESENESLNELIMLVKNVKISLHDSKNSENINENYHMLEKAIENIEQQFSRGELMLTDKAIAEKISNYYYKELLDVKDFLDEEKQLALQEKLVAKLFCNFSLFQSTPDIWGLQQIFPIMPAHGLHERPGIKSRIYDLTCDSDGRIDSYVQEGGIKPYLTLHEFHPNQEYVLGIFLVGAYQEILGDMHNLFGDTNAVNIVMNEDGSYQICDEEPGDTVAEILSYLHIDTGCMRQHWLEMLRQQNVTTEVKKFVIEDLESSLRANSYLA